MGNEGVDAGTAQAHKEFSQMNVVLLKDVERLGTEGTIIHVKPGFARNCLIPQGLAVPATDQNVKAIEETRKQRERKITRIKEGASALKKKIEARSFTLKLSLGEHDKPFGSITVQDIADALSQEGFSVEKHAIRLDEPIKALGVYEISVRLHSEITAVAKFWIVKE